MAEPPSTRIAAPGTRLPGDDAETEIGLDDRPRASLTELDEPGRHVRVFGSHAFFRLWLAQVVSATGDWLGLIAITALAAKVSAGSEGVAIGLVLAARIGPGFFLAPITGVFADRLDRRKLMVGCDIGRAAVLACLPFVDNVLGLVVASLVLEVFTLLWTPAKEATVPNLVPPERLASTNSLSLVAAYGTFPVGAGLFALLSRIAEALSDAPFASALRLDQDGLAFYVDSLTFLTAALIVATLSIPSPTAREKARSRRINLGAGIDDLKEGWQFAFLNPTVRAVNLGLATGLIGGGMLVPLGAVFSNEVLGEGEAGFGLLTFALGLGVCVGVLTVAALQSRLPKLQVFQAAVLAAGGSLLAAASMSSMGAALVLVAALGVCAGVVYVLGFTVLHESVDDALRGRIFGALYTLVRLCVLLSFLVGPVLAELLDGLSGRLVDRHVEILGVGIALPGVRLALWAAGAIIVGAGLLATWSVRGPEATAREET
ncbi:MFS transporter [Actinomarinicola tropica]|uniref:MFS transporter n=1 Tax=Actinomarinicola tropica TaxID=2789776 RepID=A0A5Q2RL02_9ACTN|nr:MFS transporter [Actinomarinicola tropica]QGG96513.1 MFS transporter [Actinomarinicola tropica]